MKTIAQNKRHLKKLIKQEIKLNGNQCDLNFIDVSHIKNMKELFKDSQFNGRIDKWDVSNVEDMSYMFFRSQFNGDISQWDVSHVKNMDRMFLRTKFNGDISQWNTSRVEDMSRMFFGSRFNKDIAKWNVSAVKFMTEMFNYSDFNYSLTDWEPYNLIQINIDNIFTECMAEPPYWSFIEDKTLRDKTIYQYILERKLNNELNDDNKVIKKVKL